VVRHIPAHDVPPGIRINKHACFFLVHLRASDRG
jgi:hypothetical protein